MKMGSRSITVTIDGSSIRMRRTTGGVIELWGRDDLDLARGLGFAHAMDRAVQMMLTRLAGQGRLCECLRHESSLLELDIFARQAGFAYYARQEAENLSQRARALGQAYCAGVNAYLGRHPWRWEFRLVGYRPEPWRIADTLLIVKLMSYLGLAQLQQDLEKLIIQAIHRGASLDRLKQLFAPHLDGLDEPTVSLIRSVHLAEPLLCPELRFQPALRASNSWAVSGRKSASGFPIHCNDPHLECSRLPAIWYEFVGHTADDYRIGVSMPGIPGLIMGRTRHVSMGFTYGFMDMVDYFVEECRGGRYRQGDAFEEFEVREEIIRRKKAGPLRVFVRENARGLLESDPRRPDLPDGYYLCRAFTCHRAGAAQTLDALASLADAQSVPELQRIARRVCVSFNWVLADRQGNIGYQQSGYLPARSHSGLYPLAGWVPEHVWRGIVPGEKLATLMNPCSHIIVTANDDWNPSGGPLAVNMSMGPYRAERIAELLDEKDHWTVADMERIQADVCSTHARRFMELVRPLVPDNPTGRILARWDLRYDAPSRGAVLFEAFYEKLTGEVFGRMLFGCDAWDAMVAGASVFTFYFHRFDQILLGDDLSWFPGGDREGLFRRILEEITALPPEKVPPWAERRQVVMHNLFFSGKLPRWLSRLLRVDYGPVTVEGGRATVVQSARFVHQGRLIHFAPSYRYVADLGTDRVHTALAGGPSDRIGSPWYTSDVQRWLGYTYKTLAAEARPDAGEPAAHASAPLSG